MNDVLLPSSMPVPLSEASANIECTALNCHLTYQGKQPSSQVAIAILCWCSLKNFVYVAIHNRGRPKVEYDCCTAERSAEYWKRA